MKINSFDWEETPQLSFIQVLIAFIIPSTVGFLGFRVILPTLVSNGTPALLAYLWVGIFALFIFVLGAIFLLQGEAKMLNISLWTRMCMKKLSLKKWIFFIFLGVASLVLIIASQKITLAFINGLNLQIPDYMPFFLNPQINPEITDSAILSPGLPIQGSYFIIPLMAIFLLLNILTEELYFRAWMQPKLTRYGNLGWIMNGIFFALYHSFQLWLFPTLLVGGLAFAFIFYRSRSVWTVFVLHLIGNFLLSILGVVIMVIG